MDAPQTENLVTTSCAASPCLRPGKSLTSEILRKMQADIAYLKCDAKARRRNCMTCACLESESSGQMNALQGFFAPRRKNCTHYWCR